MERSFSSTGTKRSLMADKAVVLCEASTRLSEANVAGMDGLVALTSCGSHTIMLPEPRCAQA